MSGIDEWNERWVAAAFESGKLNQQDAIGVTPVWHAVYFSKPEWVTKLLDAGADPLAHDDERIERTKPRTITVCLWNWDTQGLDVPTGRMTLLHVACASMYPERVVELILDRGFDVNARDPLGGTPLHIMAFNDKTNSGYENNSLGLIDRLLRAGADPNLVDRGGHMALDHAKSHKVFERLLEAGASPDGGPLRPPPIDWCRSIVERCAALGDVRGLELLLKHGLDITKHPGAIVLAGKRGHAAAVRLLVEAGARVRGLQHDTFFETAIEAAASAGQIETCEATGMTDATPDELGRALVVAVSNSSNSMHDPALAAGRVALYRWLLERGARVDTRNIIGDVRGDPLLILAAAFGHRELANLLLAHGADPKTKALDGKTAYETALHAYKKGNIDDARFVMAAIAEAGGGPPKPPAAPAAPPAKVAKAGARVTHAKFGGGAITAIAGDKWTVKFDSGETRTLVAKVLTLA